MSEATTPFVIPAQPLLSTDVSAFVLVVLGVIYAALWRRDREPGMLWLGAGFGALGLWYAVTRWNLPSGIHVTGQGLLSLLPLSLMLIGVGVARYLERDERSKLIAMALMLLLPITGLLIVGASNFVAIKRSVMALVLTPPFFVMGAVAFWAARREPGAGHRVLGVALVSIPLSSIIALAAGIDPLLVRYTAPLPVVVLGLVLLTVSLLRRRQALENEVVRRKWAEADLVSLNASLELQVAQRTADLQEMVVALGSFNRSVSHDLRGPLGGIAGLVALAEDALQRGDSAPALRMLPLIRRQSESSMELVAALLELARVGDAPMHRQPVDLAALARDVAQSLQAAHADRAMTRVDVSALPTADADPSLLRAVFTNLIGNGLKFCAGRVDGRIEVRGRNDGGTVTIEVADNGVGFDNAEAGTLFKPFQRLHGAEFSGNSVGLSIVRRAVERHGGQVWAEGRPGAGATFSFSLPKVA